LRKVSKKFLSILVAVCIVLSTFAYTATIRPLLTSKVEIDETIVFLTYARQNRTASIESECAFCNELTLSIPVNWSDFLQPFFGHYRCRTVTVFNFTSLSISPPGSAYVKSVHPSLSTWIWGYVVLNVTIAASALSSLSSPITIGMNMNAINVALSPNC
jgi:hypothetical protein